MIFFLLAMKKGDILQDILDKSSNKTQSFSQKLSLATIYQMIYMDIAIQPNN